MFSISAIYFEQNYLDIPEYSNLIVYTETPFCTRESFTFRLPCFFGYLKNDELIKLPKQTNEYMYYYGTKFDDFYGKERTVLYRARELATPMEAAILGKRFTSGITVHTYFMLSKDTQYALLFTYNAESYKRATYVIDINTGHLMKISEGDIPVLMP